MELVVTCYEYGIVKWGGLLAESVSVGGNVVGSVVYVAKWIVGWINDWAVGSVAIFYCA